MPSKLDSIKLGRKFFRWTPIERLEASYFLCVCDCGESKRVSGYNLLREEGNSRSCGCLRNEIVKTINVTHGHTSHGKRSRTYNIWCNMRTGCTNPKASFYRRYGGRGIKICKRWDKFENFLEDMGHCQDGLSIDRIDNDGNYCKSNCRWGTEEQQHCNTSRNVFVTAHGKTATLSQWAKEMGTYNSLLYYRARAGWSPEEIVSPIRLTSAHKPIPNQKAA